MDNLPQRIQVKRKRDQPAPDSLYLQPDNEQESNESSKRVRTENTYFFKRVTSISANVNDATTVPAPSVSKEQPAARRFHLTRPTTATTSPLQPPQSRKRRRETSIATFVERPIAAQAPLPTPGPPASNSQLSNRPTTPPRKRPSARAAPTQSLTPSTAPKVKPPSNATLVALQMMAEEVANAETHAAPTPPYPSSTSKMKYKPHPPSKRYKERHPPKVEDTMDIDDSADYITETYVLQPVPSSAATAIPFNAGVLIIPASEEELWESYLANDAPSSDEDLDTDDEDSNAEDWHGADYPEDEDEDGRMFSDPEPVYSDQEKEGDHSDEDDHAYHSDDEDGGLGAGWKRTYI